jgi:hypothetical protein
MNWGLAGAVSLPLIEGKLALRISGGRSENPGWADAYYGPYDGTPDDEDVNQSTNDDLRVVALFSPPTTSRCVPSTGASARAGLHRIPASVDPPYFQNTAGQSSWQRRFQLWSFSAVIDFNAFPSPVRRATEGHSASTFRPRRPDSSVSSSRKCSRRSARQLDGRGPALVVVRPTRMARARVEPAEFLPSSDQRGQ